MITVILIFIFYPAYKVGLPSQLGIIPPVPRKKMVWKLIVYHTSLNCCFLLRDWNSFSSFLEIELDNLCFSSKPYIGSILALSYGGKGAPHIARL